MKSLQTERGFEIKSGFLTKGLICTSVGVKYNSGKGEFQGDQKKFQKYQKRVFVKNDHFWILENGQLF